MPVNKSYSPTFKAKLSKGLEQKIQEEISSMPQAEQKEATSRLKQLKKGNKNLLLVADIREGTVRLDELFKCKDVPGGMYFQLSKLQVNKNKSYLQTAEKLVSDYRDENDKKKEHYALLNGGIVKVRRV